MLLHNDVVTDRKPKPGSFSGGLRCEERVEHLFFYFGWNTRAIIPNPDFHTIAKAAGRGRKGWFIAIAISFSSTRVRSWGNTSACPAAGSSDCSMVMLKPCFSARAP